MLIERTLFSKISTLNRSILLIGPRQTGKSTLIKSLCPDLTINLADQETFIRYLSDPGRLRTEIGASQSIFIDEVQRIPSLLNTIQALIDEKQSRQFFITGSSARKLKRGEANLLPGRVLSYELGPLTHQELASQFEIKKALRLGLLPGIYFEPNEKIAQKILRTYSMTYLQEEIQAEALTRNLEGFSRLFQIVVSRNGQQIDFSKFASQAMIERTSARRYFDILVDTLIVDTIEPFSKSKTRRLVQHPKYYFFDCGVINGVLQNFDVSLDRIGVLFETLFLQLVRSCAKAHDDNLRISTYRTDRGAEVDFIIETKSQVFAVEVKASKNVGKSDLTGLESFASFYGKKFTPLVVCLDDSSRSLDGVALVGLQEALKMFGYPMKEQLKSIPL